LNVIFDLGGVVFNWDPDKLIADIFENKEIHHIVRSGFINHHDWVDLDRGTLTEEEAIKRGSGRTGVPESKLKRFMQAVPPFLTPIDESLQLVQDLKDNAHKLYVLSNMHIASITHVENEYSFWHFFDGKVISCRIHKVKPEKDIYQYLLDRYQLSINETVFIDDTDINLKVAADFGIMTIKFENPDQCRRELTNLGCLS
jgi:putative hydrolase of the HAD superfamily